MPVEVISVDQQAAQFWPAPLLADIPKKQRRGAAQSLAEYEQATDTRNQAIVAAYGSGGYTLKEIGSHFGLHYSRVSKIVAKVKT